MCDYITNNEQRKLSAQRKETIVKLEELHEENANAKALIDELRDENTNAKGFIRFLMEQLCDAHDEMERLKSVPKQYIPF